MYAASAPNSVLLLATGSILERLSERKLWSSGLSGRPPASLGTEEEMSFEATSYMGCECEQNVSGTMRLCDEPCRLGRRQVQAPRKTSTPSLVGLVGAVACLLQEAHVSNDSRPVSSKDVRDDPGQGVSNSTSVVAARLTSNSDQSNPQQQYGSRHVVLLRLRLVAR